jgi:hypothetical protein
MPTSDSLPDVAVGRHPDYGIVAANPKQLASSTRMLKGFDFHPVPDHPTLFALAYQHRDGPERATRAVALLRKAGYQVDVDAAFDPSLAPEPTRPHFRPPRVEPDIAFAEHPQLGVVAATADTMHAVESGGAILESHGWRYNHALDIYTLPVTTDRGEALGKVAEATLSMHRSDLQVAVQPILAQEVAARRLPAPAAMAAHGRDRDVPTRRLPLSAAALAASPARAGLHGKPPIPAPAAPAAAARPADPRLAFSRSR